MLLTILFRGMSDEISMESATWLLSPSKVRCKKQTIIQGLSVCEDRITDKCAMLTVIMSQSCDDIGSLEFENYWSAECQYLLIHYVTKSIPDKKCPGIINNLNSNLVYNQFQIDKDYAKCSDMCLHKYRFPKYNNFDVFKIQLRGSNTTLDAFDGIQYEILSNFIEFPTRLNRMVDQIIISMTIKSSLLFRPNRYFKPSGTEEDITQKKNLELRNVYRYLRHFKSFSMSYPFPSASSPLPMQTEGYGIGNSSFRFPTCIHSFLRNVPSSTRHIPSQNLFAQQPSSRTRTQDSNPHSSYFTKTIADNIIKYDTTTSGVAGVSSGITFDPRHRAGKRNKMINRFRQQQQRQDIGGSDISTTSNNGAERKSESKVKSKEKKAVIPKKINVNTYIGEIKNPFMCPPGQKFKPMSDPLPIPPHTTQQILSSDAISDVSGGFIPPCESLTNSDIFGAMSHLAHPPRRHCDNITTIAGLAVCEDNLPGNCSLLSVIITNKCDTLGDLEFEKYWSARCDVTVVNYVYELGPDRQCPVVAGLDIRFVQVLAWYRRCFACLYRLLMANRGWTKVSLLKIQQQLSPLLFQDPNDGLQFKLLSDLFLHDSHLHTHIPQILLRVAYTPTTLIDDIGRARENAYNMWATSQYLSSYASFFTAVESGPEEDSVVQFALTFNQTGLDPSINYYSHSFLKIPPQPPTETSTIATTTKSTTVSQGTPPLPAVANATRSYIEGRLPPYCSPPADSLSLLSQSLSDMSRWINEEIRVRCNPTNLWIECDRSRDYDAFIPCVQELADTLAEDYAAARGWCNYKDSRSEIVPLQTVSALASEAFQQPPLPPPAVRLAFFFTVYSDADLVERLLARLHSPQHYYLIHLDKAGTPPSFERRIRNFTMRYPNMFIAKELLIVYGASTASVLLARAMAWFSRHAAHWDYFVAVTGSDYPLVPLAAMESMLASQHPPMPFVMSWSSHVGADVKRLVQRHPKYLQDRQLNDSIGYVVWERGDPIGANAMPSRCFNFGPPLTCHDKKQFYHLDNRRNLRAKLPDRFDSQWLFPRQRYGSYGWAALNPDPTQNIPTHDGVPRVWMKSDPATTGIYDAASVRYIINSEEGRKYFHFFKYMLLGSEEHYFVSLLYNWNRTKDFVGTLRSQSVWNTWKLGLSGASMNSSFKTHTQYVSESRWDLLVGLSRRGVFFARKFSSVRNALLLDKIDSFILLNESNSAGSDWPPLYWK